MITTTSRAGGEIGGSEGATVAIFQRDITRGEMHELAWAAGHDIEAVKAELAEFVGAKPDALSLTVILDEAPEHVLYEAKVA